MIEHVHDWEAGNFGGFAGASCNCDELLNESEIERRLNATDRLSLYDARAISAGMHDGMTSQWAEERLDAYAAALEGK